MPCSFAHDFYREIVNGPQPTTLAFAEVVSQYIEDMFTPRVCAKGDTNKNRTKGMICRDNWMLFLGKVYVLSFNPILPHQSGSDTTRMKYRLAAAIRHFVFGSDSELNYKKDSRVNGMLVVSKIPLPEIQCNVVLFDVSLARHFWS